MARIKDVAREAGVAASTVSLVLNNKGYVSAATRRKIEAAMEKLRYVPSEVARNLSLSRTKTVGVIVPSVSHPFFSELLESLESTLYALGYKTLLCCTKEKDNAERAFLDMLRRKTMDGIIMGAHTLDTALYANLDRPIIAFDRFLREDIPIVHADHQYGGRLAAEAFLRRGCRHVVAIMGYQGVATPANDYHRVFAETMRQSGAAVHQIEMKWNAFAYRDFLQAADELFARFPAADGVFGSDLAIASCLRAAAAHGRRVPNDVKLLAYDGTSLTRIGAQTVTAVRQPIEGLAALAAKKIVARAEGTKDTLPWILKPSLIKGETC